MPYQKQNWENLPLEVTPISAERLEHLETQYDEAVALMASAMRSHVNNPTPHKAYDIDMPNLTLLFENGLA